MRIVLAPDKFKGCLPADRVAAAMAAGIRAARPDAKIDSCPISDGGEGFARIVTAALGGRFVTRRVTGPLPEMKVDATFGIVETKSPVSKANGRTKPPETATSRTAIIEMSAASGLALLRPDEYNPEATTTFGTGELLLAAVDEGCSRILLGVGGSATIDGGIGCCHAAGLPVLLDGGEPTSPTEPLCGRDLARVVRIKSHRGDRLAGVEIVVATDVNNVLCGKHGAARVFGSQKGASPYQAEQFDRWLADLARRCDAQESASRPGAGAAGGLAFAMLAFFGATLHRGADLVIDATNLRQRLSGADLCITGEGKLDASSLADKAPIKVARLCAEMNVPCVAVVGSNQLGAAAPFARAVTLASTDREIEHAITHAESLITQAAGDLVNGA